jgi:hypothetical protein
MYPTYTVEGATAAPTITLTRNSLNIQATFMAGQTATVALRSTQNANRAATLTATTGMRQTAIAFTAQYTPIDYRNLRDAPTACNGQKIRTRVRVTNILTDITVLGYFTNTTDPLYVELNHTVTGLAVNDSLLVYGVCKGFKIVPMNGVSLALPFVTDAYIDKGTGILAN